MEAFAALNTKPYLTAELFFQKTQELWKNWDCVKTGYSMQKRPIHFFQRGSGKTRVLIWTQMHGNESTATFSLADTLQWLQSHPEIFSELSIGIIPILNPDGAFAFTRQNAAGVDINRDAPTQSVPESRFLIECARCFQPNWAFNMHDQRSIFSVGASANPATMAFLAPVFPPDFPGRESNRDMAMGLIGSIVGRYSEAEKRETSRFSDEYYPLAVGEYFQAKGIATILVESGGGELFRDKARARTTHFLSEALRKLSLVQSFFRPDDVKNYLAIEQNQTSLRDVIFRNVLVGENRLDFAFQLKYLYQEEKFSLELDTVGDLKHLFGYREVNLHSAKYELQHIPSKIGGASPPKSWINFLENEHPQLWSLLA